MLFKVTEQLSAALVYRPAFSAAESGKVVQTAAPAPDSSGIVRGLVGRHQHLRFDN